MYSLLLYNHCFKLEIIMTTEKKDFKTSVDSVVSAMVQGEDGNWQIPPELLENTPEEVAYAAKLEKRYRDTQSAYTKAQQKSKSLETVNGKLTEHMIRNATLHITDEQRADLDALRATNPEAWREKLSGYEEEAKQLVTSKVSEFQQEGVKVSELELRAQKVAEFKEEVGVELTDSFIEENLPAKYIKDLEKGTIDFDTFLQRSKDYLTKAKIIKGSDEEPENAPNLGKLGGGHKPAKAAIEGGIVESYKTEIY
jgi:hypothetical protein